MLFDYAYDIFCRINIPLVGEKTKINQKKQQQPSLTIFVINTTVKIKDPEHVMITKIIIPYFLMYVDFM